MKEDFRLFQNEIVLRNIKYLVHFTPTINLLGICETGAIMSRRKLVETDTFFQDMSDYVVFTDDIRLDGKDYINTSIQYPNEILFTRFRERTKADPWKKWCVLLIDPKYVYEDETIFSVTNAANRNNREKIGITGDFKKFKMMFSDNLQIVSSNYSKKITRNKLAPNMTTDVQAEVLIKNNIPFKDIFEIIFENEEDLVVTKEALPIKVDNMKVDKRFFQPRLSSQCD